MQVDIEDFVYSTYLGGGDPLSLAEDHIKDVIVDSQDNIIVTGNTLSNDFPVSINAFQATFAGGGNDVHGVGGDAFLAKFDCEGQLLWSTFLGGSSMDGGLFVEVVDSDNIIVMGITHSNDFPVSPDAFQEDYSGYYDIFLTKFLPNGSLLYSSYLGRAGDDRVNDFELDSSGNLVISGGTNSANFPVTPDAAQPILNGGSDGFFMRISPNCSTILYSTFLGGSSYEGIDKITLDNQGNIIATGFTGSYDFPVTEDAYQDSLCGFVRDFFIAKYNSSGQLMYSTYFGGSHLDDCFGVAADSAGSIIVTGRTWSDDFPITVNAWQANYSNIEVDGFVAKLTADGQELIFSSYFGGAAWDTIHHVDVDSYDNILVSGSVGSEGFPLIDAFQEERSGSCDVIIMKLSPTGQPLFGSYLGGDGQDHPWHQYLSNDHLYVVGFTSSTDFLTYNDSYQQTNQGNRDGFLFRFDIDGYLSALHPTSSQPSSTPTSNVSSMTTTETATNSENTSGFDIYVVFLALVSILTVRLRNWLKRE
jgi:hypothetical protein